MNKKVAAVVSSSKMISKVILTFEASAMACITCLIKVREKQKMEKQMNKAQSTESQPSGSQQGVGEVH